MLTDRYSSFDNKKNFINRNASLKNLTDVCRMLPIIASDNGSITEIEYVSTVTDVIKTRIKDCFGVTYTSVEDGYILDITDTKITIFAENERGGFYGLLSLRDRGIKGIGNGIVYSYPRLPFRMIKLYLPSHENIPFFKKFIDMCAFYGYNAIMLEVGGAMEYKSHPEVNEGWIEYSREASEGINNPDKYPNFPFKDKRSKETHYKNSIHCENGGGEVLTQNEMRDLIDYCEERYLEVIPEMPSFSHSDYLLTRHRELAEWKDDLYPDTYCPSNPDTYKLLFDLLTEIIDVFKPKRLNIGHDELMSLSCKLCDNCKGKALDKLYYNDIMKIYSFLKERNVTTMMWCEQLMDCVFKNGQLSGGTAHDIISYWTKEKLGYKEATYHLRDKLPKDIEMLNWYWSINEIYDKDFLERGFKMSFCNFEPLRVKSIVKRLDAGVHGIGLSNWSKVDELHIHRNGVYLEMALSAMIMWNNDYDEFAVDENLAKAAESLLSYRIANAPYKAEIIHTFTKDIPFKWYVDGLEVDKDENIIGSYNVFYDDGTKESIPMEYSKTVGFDRISRTYEEQDWCYSNKTDRRILDTGYSSGLIFRGERILYKYVIPSEKAISKVDIDVKDEFKEYVDVEEIIYA